jgi:hypothetical protein
VPRVRPNAATENVAELQAAIAGRDLDAVAAHIATAGEVVDHPTGRTHDREQSLRTWRSLLSAEGAAYRYEPLASLGDSLALVRQWVSAQRLVSQTLDIGGAYEIENVALVDADPPRGQRHTKLFAADKLGDAVVHLYERHADRMPEGPARERAAAIAGGVAATTGPIDLDRVIGATADDIEYVDRRMFGMGPARGAGAFLRGARIRLELASGLEIQVNDVCDLRPDALLVRATSVGTRAGGAYQFPVFALYAFDEDGRIGWWELFDGDAQAAALARFDELAAALARQRIPVRPNSATASAARLDQAIAAGDLDRLRGIHTDDAQIVDHTTGTELDRQAIVDSWRALLRAEDPVHDSEPLATLGDSLALCRLTATASGFMSDTVDVGPYHHEEIDLIEADAQQRCRRADLFGTGQLGDAIKALYERHAELLPEGPERERAAATARSVAVVLEPPQPETIGEVLALHVAYTDHRSLGWGPAHGVVPFIRALRTIRGAAARLEMTTGELLALRADALLVRRIVTGVRTDGGGTYRRRPIVLWLFGADGRVTHWEQWDDDQRDEALAHFEQLATPRALARFVENTATQSLDRFVRVWDVRNWEALRASYAHDFVLRDRRAIAQLDLDLEQNLAFQRPLFEMRSSRVVVEEILATRGDRLALCRQRTEVADDLVGPSEIPSLLVFEVDREGRYRLIVRFDLDALEAAYAELDALFAAGEAKEHAAMWSALSGPRNALAAKNWGEVVRLFAPDFVAEDHRPLGFGVVHTPAEYMKAVRSVSELRPDIALRIDHLVLGERAVLILSNWVWREDDETFAIPGLVVFAMANGDRVDRVHHYSIDQLAAARAKFAELGSSASSWARREIASPSSA